MLAQSQNFLKTTNYKSVHALFFPVTVYIRPFIFHRVWVSLRLFTSLHYSQIGEFDK